MAQQSKVRRVKQQTDMEWKAKILRKLEDLSELRSLRKDIRRIMVVLEKLAGIEGQDSENEQFSWPVSKGEGTEVQESRKKENRGRKR